MGFINPDELHPTHRNVCLIRVLGFTFAISVEVHPYATKGGVQRILDFDATVELLNGLDAFDWHKATEFAQQLDESLNELIEEPPTGESFTFSPFSFLYWAIEGLQTREPYFDWQWRGGETREMDNALWQEVIA